MVSQSRTNAAEIVRRREMLWISGGGFTRGSDRHYPEERPARHAEVDGFWIDPAPVTNSSFAQFVAATDYVTLAEKPPRAEDYPGAPPENLRAGSMVFTAPAGQARVGAEPAWWSFAPGADWRHPSGPGSSIAGLDDHPVVHVAWCDVLAYALWADVDLPTENEWEFAARSARDGAEFAWGDELEPDGRHMANVWQGRFPYHNSGADGWQRTSPVRSYPANDRGLYDMIGNVWEWTADWWMTGEIGSLCCSARRDASISPNDPLRIPRKVLKGGSFLCAPNYCRRYRPAARHPQPIDTSTLHVGFRCVVRP